MDRMQRFGWVIHYKTSDGLMLAVWNYNGQLSDEPVRIEIDWTFRY